MDKNAYTGLMGKIGPYALLLGALTLPMAALSQTDNNTEASSAAADSESAPPAQQPTSQTVAPVAEQGSGGYGMAPAWDPQTNTAGGARAAARGYMGGRGMGGFMGYMQQPGGRHAQGYGPGMPTTGYGQTPFGPSPFEGGSPFDNAAMPPQQPNPEHMKGGGSVDGYVGGGHPSAFGMGASPFSSPRQGDSSISGQSPRYAMPSGAGQGMFPRNKYPKGSISCGHKPFMGQGGMGQGGMGSGWMGPSGAKLGIDIAQLPNMPGLSDEQQEKIYDILDEQRRVHWQLMGESMEHSAKLRGLYSAKQLDAKAIGSVYGKIFDIKRKIIESSIEAKQRAMEVLTDEQRESL